MAAILLCVIEILNLGQHLPFDIRNTEPNMIARPPGSSGSTKPVNTVA